jgi:hypothetical protein
MGKSINFTHNVLDGWVVKNNPNPGWADESWPQHEFYANGRLTGWYSASKPECTCSFYYPNNSTHGAPARDYISPTKNPGPNKKHHVKVPTFNTPMGAKRAIENAYLCMAMP